MTAVIADTGPIVALLDGSDSHHSWARECFRHLAPPLATCEAVLCEAYFLLQRFPPGKRTLLKMISGGAFSLPFRAGDHLPDIAKLLVKYDDTPMDFANACLVQMAETSKAPKVWTIDSDFKIYRLNNRRVVPVLAPWS
ncbi:MAG: PIN domain-containing protein [Verrucomicrobiota bacterium]